MYRENLRGVLERAAISLLVFGLMSFEVHAAARPNFIIFLADDMAWNDCKAYGHPSIRTPNIDRLARDGLRFNNAFLTCSSCSPSRSSILTGRYPHATGASELHLPLPAEQFAFTEALRTAGYYTASAGKWHLGEAAREKFDAVLGRGGPSGCETWVAALEGRPEGKPFFLWLAASDPHRSYSENTIPEPHRPEDAIVPPYLPDTPEVRRDLALYYDEIARLDSYMGQVLDALDEAGIADETFVLFMSDNGRPFPRCKTTVYDSGIKTPFIVRFPAMVKAGSQCDSLVSSVDIAPTIMELAGIESSATFQGKSFARTFAETGATIRKYAFAEHNWHDYAARERAVRSTRFTYIRNEYPDLPGTPPADAVRSDTHRAMQRLFAQGKLNAAQASVFIATRPTEELYDQEADPHSLNNLANDARYTDTLNELRAALSDWSRRTEDVAPEQRRPDEFDRDTGERLR